MPLILAVEPDRRQGAHITQIVRQRVGADLILAETTELALAQIGNRVPDLILVPPLLSPTDDAALAAALRVIATAAHVQMLTTPLFASAAPAPRARGVLAAFRRAKPTKPATDGCDPAEFAQQISSYLESAAEERASAQYIEPPLPASAPAPRPTAEAPQRYVPLEPGRLYRDETSTSQGFEAPPLPETIAEPAAAFESEPIGEIAEPLAGSASPAVEFETEQLPVYEPTYAETILEPVAAEPLIEASEPAFETAEPLFHAPEPVFETAEPVFETTELLLETSEPMLETPEPVLESTELMLEAPESILETPEPVLETPEPVFAAQEPFFETPEPVLESLEPIFETPHTILEAQAPILEVSDPTFEAPEPVFEAHAPVLETPEPIFEASEPILEMPDPLAARGSAYPRRIGFVVHEKEPDLVAESFDIENEPIEIAASIDTDFVVEAVSETGLEEEPLATYSASVDDEAIEIVDVDLSSVLSEFDELHVVDLQSDIDASGVAINDIGMTDVDMNDVEVVEILETPEIVETAVTAAPQARVIDFEALREFDALKEFAASLEAMTTPEQTLATAHHAVASEAFEFDDLFPRREPVEPSPLAAWHSWTPLEGVTAEAWDAVVPAHVVERAVERPTEKLAPERPNWVQLVESLRIDVERRRSEQPAAAAPTPARKPPTRPVQDEWGLFDPAQCGFAALLEKLDEITEANASRPRRSA